MAFAALVFAGLAPSAMAAEELEWIGSVPGVRLLSGAADGSSAKGVFAVTNGSEEVIAIIARGLEGRGWTVTRKDTVSSLAVQVSSLVAGKGAASLLVELTDTAGFTTMVVKVQAGDVVLDPGESESTATQFPPPSMRTSSERKASSEEPEATTSGAPESRRVTLRQSARATPEVDRPTPPPERRAEERFEESRPIPERLPASSPDVTSGR